MPWQRDLLDVALEVDELTGRLFYRLVVVTTPRQVGKTSVLLPMWVHRGVEWPRQRISWTMQSANDARKKWVEEHVPALEACPEVRAAILPGSRGIRRANGSEHVMFRNGSLQTLMATTLSSGHGNVVDLGVIDEAMAQGDDRLEQAIRPAMKTRDRPGLPGPQLWIVSTVGPAGGARWFHGWQDAGRLAVEQGSCEESRICFVEYSAWDDADPGDPETWWSCIPALGFTIGEDVIRLEWEQAQLTPGGVEGFRRQALNQRPSAGGGVFGPGCWVACLRPEREVKRDGCWFGVEVSADRGWASIGASDGRAVELVERREGTVWLGERLGELVARYRPVGVVADVSGAAGGVVDVLRQVAGERFVEANGQGLARCCGMLFDAVVAGEVSHGGQPDLDLAVGGAARRVRGDAFVWDRRGEVDVSALVAVTLAFGHARKPAAEAPKPVVVFA